MAWALMVAALVALGVAYRVRSGFVWLAVGIVLVVVVPLVALAAALGLAHS